MLSKVMRSGFDLVVAGILGSRVHVVGVPGSGCPYESVQSAVDGFEATMPLPSPDRLVLVTPGAYDEDVTVHQNNIHFLGLGRPRIGSLTFTDCTAKSLVEYNDTGDWEVLKADPSIGESPEGNEVRGIAFQRTSGPPWVGFADSSLRWLGQAEGGSKLGKRRPEIIDCHLYSSLGGYCLTMVETCRLLLQGCLIKGMIDARQILGLWLEQSTMLGKLGMVRDTTKPEPGADSHLGVNGEGSHIEDLVIEGDEPLVGKDYLRKCNFDAIHNAAKSAASVSDYRDCYVERDIEISNAGPRIYFRAGRYMGHVIGAGAGGFTGIVGNNS